MSLTPLIQSLRIVENLLKQGEAEKALHRLRGVLQGLEHFDAHSAGGLEIQYLRHFVLNNVVSIKGVALNLMNQADTMEKALIVCQSIWDEDRGARNEEGGREEERAESSKLKAES